MQSYPTDRFFDLLGNHTNIHKFSFGIVDKEQIVNGSL